MNKKQVKAIKLYRKLINTGRINLAIRIFIKYELGKIHTYDKIL